MAYFTTDDDSRIFYVDRGTGRPVLFVHGFGTSHMVWEASTLALGGHGRTIAIDLRGHGRSDRPIGPYTFERLARDVDGLLRRLDVRDVGYVGWSMAAQLGLTYMRLFGERISRLLLVAPVMPPYTEHGLSRAHVAGLLTAMRSTKDRPQLFLELARNNFFHGDVPEATKLWFWSLVMDASFQCDSLLLDLAALDERQELPKIDVPVTIVHGRHDKQCSIEIGRYLARILPKASLVEFEKSGHVPFVDEQERWEQVLRQFAEAEHR